MNDKIKLAWERRAAAFKNKRQAVMQQSLPWSINQYVHELHVGDIMRVLPKGKCKCLDIGCGYGRLATELTRRNNGVFVSGIDVSPTFVHLFNKKLGNKGRAIVGDMRKLPFRSNSFDLVYCVVSLMYLEKPEEQQKAIYEIIRVLKSRGVAVIIEPNRTGDTIIKLFGLLPFILRKVLRRKKVETFGVIFSWGTIDGFIKHAGAKLVEKRGYPFFTLFFLTSLALSKISQKLSGFILSVIYRLDTFFPRARFSSVIAYIVTKTNYE